jgi:hypothetical protein
MTRRMRFACRISKAKPRKCKFTVFPWQQWSRERSSILHYTYICCLVSCRWK